MRKDLFTEDGNENFGILYCTTMAANGKHTLLGKQWEAAPEHAYTERLPYHLEIAPAYLNTVVDQALAAQLSPVVVHSHPVSRSAQYSPSDDHGESRLLPVLAALLPGMRSASLLMTTSDVTGRSYGKDGFTYLTEIQVGGQPFQIVPPDRRDESDGAHRQPPATHDRQTRAIGVAPQRLLESLRIAIVGAGGTGSAVAEQIGRLGVRDILVIDPDRVEPSNLSRMWGSVPHDAEVGAYKAEVVAGHLRRFAPGLTARALVGDVTRESVVALLTDSHLVFGCTDNHWSRAVLNRFAHQYIVPVIDMGVRIDARPETIAAIGGQVSLLGPGFACLRCAGLLDQKLIRAESMSPLERRRLAKEGYVQGVGDPAPSVISLNTVVAGLAVTTALRLVTGVGGRNIPPLLRYDGVAGEVFRVSPRHDVGCDVCDPSEGVVALGQGQAVSAYD